jgi:Cytochrome c7 and related cytochrome c
MAQIFHPSMNTVAKGSILGAVIVLGLVGFIVGGVVRSPYITYEDVPRAQPVPFSHEHHVSGLGLDCRYCHTGVEDSPFAGVPATKICMTCHSQVWTNAPILEPVRESWRTNTPIRWTRVHELPDFVHFNHSIHIAKGIGCTSCHGQVDQMPLMWKNASLEMSWCIACHKNPEKNIRPRDQVFNMKYQQPANQAELGAELVAKYQVNKRQLINCSVCHY